MGRLAGMKCYLIGAMDRVPDGGITWRADFTPWLQKRGVFVQDPANKPMLYITNEFSAREDINRMKQEGRYAEIRPKYGDAVRGTDLRMVDESSFLPCYLDLDTHPCGTYEELFKANSEKKPIITVVKQGKVNAPNWLFMTLPHEFIFDDFDQAKAYLDHIDQDEEIDTLGRWRFFDWPRLVKETQDAYGSF